MHCRAWFRAPVILLLLVLSAAPAFAAGKAPARSREPRLVAWVWQALGQIFPGLSKGRLTIDPNGVDGGPDGRGTIDPNGTDGRSTIDPDGAAATDGRWSLDPNG